MKLIVMLLVPLILGCAIGAFLALRADRDPTPQIRIEPTL